LPAKPAIPADARDAIIRMTNFIIWLQFHLSLFPIYLQNLPWNFGRASTTWEFRLSWLTLS
jgi:hypothetical protein